MTPALYRLLFPRKGERKERLYYASSKHQKKALSSSSRFVVFLSSSSSKKKRKTKEKERTTTPSPPPFGVRKNSYTKPNFWGSPFVWLFLLFVFIKVHHPFLCFFVFFFFILFVAFFCVWQECVETESSTPLVLSILCLRATNWLPPPFYLYKRRHRFLIAPQKKTTKKRTPPPPPPCRLLLRCTRKRAPLPPGRRAFCRRPTPAATGNPLFSSFEAGTMRAKWKISRLLH